MIIKRLSRTAALTALLLTLAAQSALAALPPVLERVPDDAAVVVVVKNLKDFTTKISNLGTRMNVPGVPADMLGDLTKKMHITQGLDVNGSVAFAYSMPPKPMDGQAAPPWEKPFVLLLPTTDAKAMLTELNPTPPENGISEVTIPDAGGAGEPGYVATVGNFVAFAQDKAYLTHYLAGKTFLNKALTPEQTKAFEANDAIVYANVTQFGAMVVQRMDMMAPMIKNMAAGAPGVSPAQAAMQRASLDMVFNGVRSILTDGQAALLTVRLNDAGATIGFAGHFKADSEIGKSLAQQKPLVGDPLAGLPVGSPLIVGAGTINGSTFADFMGNFYEQFATNPQVAADAAKVEAFKKYGALQKEAWALTKSVRFAMYEPKPGQKGLVAGAGIIEVTDSAKYLDLSQQMSKDNLIGLTSSGQGFKIDVVQEKDPVTVADLAFRKFSMTFTSDPAVPETPQSKMALKMMKTMYGDQLDMYQVALDGQHVLVVGGSDPTLLASAAAAAKANSGALSKTPEIMTAAKEVLPNVSGVVYLPIDRMIAVVRQLVKNNGALPTATAAADPAAAVVIKENIAPIALSGAVSGANATMEIHLPVSALINITQNIREAQGGGMQPPMPAPIQP